MGAVRIERDDVFVAVGYFLLAVASIVTTRFDNGLAFVWLPSCLLIAVAKRRPVATWPPLFLASGIGSACASTLFGAGPVLAIPLAIANMTEAAVGAAIMRRLFTGKEELGSLGWTTTLILATGIIAPLAMALIVAFPMWIVLGHGVDFTVQRIVLGHGLSNIIGVPIVALFGAGMRDHRTGDDNVTRWVELAVLFGIQVVVDVLVFAQQSMPLLFLAVLPTLIIAYRCQARAAAISLILLALISGTATIHDRGPINLYDASIGMRMQLLCFYLMTIVLTIIPIAAGLRTHARMLRTISESEQRYKMLADYSGDVILHCDARGAVKFVSPSILRVGGYDPAELLDRSIMDLIHPASREMVEAHYRFAIDNQGDTRFEYRARRKDGRWCWYESECRGVTDPSGKRGSVSVVRDISDRKSREDQLASAAMTDFLTGLPNRRAFREAAQQIINDKRVRAASIAVFDIDHFKSINDQFGHDAGDEVLQSFAAIAQRLRRKDDVMARLGGEEFAVLLPDTSLSAAVKVCERLRAEIAKTVCMTAHGAIRITVSGGVAPLTKDDLDESLRRADEALYRAKNEGRDRLLQAEAA